LAGVKSLLRKEKQFSDFRLANWNNERAARNPPPRVNPAPGWRIGRRASMAARTRTRACRTTDPDPGHDLGADMADARGGHVSIGKSPRPM
jgi:hypothetical protein